jgi:hypothetical protein
LASSAVAQEVAPAPAFLLSLHPPLQKKRRLGRGGCLWQAGSAEARSPGGTEGGTSGRRRTQGRAVRPSRICLWREQDGGAGGGPAVRRGRGHSPPPPPARGRAGQGEPARLARPRAGRGGRGPAHYAKRRAPPPRGKGKRAGFTAGVSMAAQARPSAAALPAPTPLSRLPPGLAPRRPRSRSRVCGGRPPARRAGRGEAGRRRRAGARGRGLAGRGRRPGRRGGSGAAGRAPGRRRGRGGGGLLLFLSVKGQSS